MKMCYDPSDEVMTLMDADGEEANWDDTYISMDDLWELIYMGEVETLCLDSEEDKMRFLAIAAKKAKHCSEIPEEGHSIDKDPYHDYHQDLPDATDEVDHLTDGEWRVKDIGEE